MVKQVMVVDDSKMMYMQIKNLLADSDFEAAAYCRSGEEAVEQYENVRPDVVTMDIVLPGMDGLETAQAILKKHPDAKIVMVSSLAYDDTFETAKSIGAKGFIDKPFEKEQLLTTLKKAAENAE